MKKLLFTLTCLLAMLAASLSAKAQEVTITLFPGWTWISYPKTEAMDIATALGDFVPVEGDIINSQYSSATYRNGQWRGRLQQFTPGLGYMYYSMRGEPVTLVFGGSMPQNQVLVTTSEPLLITAVSAMCGGEVTSNDGTYILVKGLCWATHENPMTNDFYQEMESGEGSFTISMTGLNISTAYYVRAYAVTPNGTVYGNEKTFTTRDGIPTVTTAEVTNIQGETAICGGNVTDNCGLTVIARGVCWSTSPNPTLDDSHTTNGSGMGNFSSSITGLSISTTYYVRAYATTSVGTGYGEQVSFTTRNGIPTVTTAEVTNIQGIVATSGGNITDDGGLAVTARGVCWSISPSPTLADFHTTDGNGTGSFSSYIIGLSTSTTYYVRAYATNSFVTVYGNQFSFTTTNDNHVYVDLGLPSGLLWATCNVGADAPEDYGDYFAWGETQPKETYNWSTYQYCNGSETSLTKYCTDSSFGYNGFTDDLTTLLPEDDAATANWGEDWRMPTRAEWQELTNNTSQTWTIQNGVYGLLFSSTNGNELFFPAAGCRIGNSFYGGNIGDNFGENWSSSLNMERSNRAGSYYFNEIDGWFGGFSNRYIGLTIRAVHCKNSIVNATANSAEGGEVSGGGTYMDCSSCTVSATANEGYTFLCWSENGEVVSNEATYSFMVSGNRNLVACFYNYDSNACQYVDLDLPSGVLWATRNVGADAPEEFGDYFAWGETQAKSVYSWNTYQYSNNGSWSHPNLTKYCTASSYGYNGFTDNLTMLLPEDDAATVNWGEDWRMPTKEEWQELLDNTTYVRITLNGVKGQLFTASNGNSIFLPATGDYNNSGSYYYGLYWSSSLNTYYNPSYAWCFLFQSDDGDFWGGSSVSSYRSRYEGHSVRPVREN